MKLTAEQFEQIVATLRSDPQIAGGTEKRRSPRVGVRMTATLVLCSGPTPQRHDARLRDLSQEGVGVLHQQQVPKASRFFLLLDRSTGGTLKVLYQVARCDRCGDRQYLIGGRLERIIDELPGTV